MTRVNQTLKVFETFRVSNRTLSLRAALFRDEATLAAQEVLARYESVTSRQSPLPTSPPPRRVTLNH